MTTASSADASTADASASLLRRASSARRRSVMSLASKMKNFTWPSADLTAVSVEAAVRTSPCARYWPSLKTGPSAWAAAASRPGQAADVYRLVPAHLAATLLTVEPHAPPPAPLGVDRLAKRDQVGSAEEVE